MGYYSILVDLESLKYYHWEIELLAKYRKLNKLQNNEVMQRIHLDIPQDSVITFIEEHYKSILRSYNVEQQFNSVIYLLQKFNSDLKTVQTSYTESNSAFEIISDLIGLKESLNIINKKPPVLKLQNKADTNFYIIKSDFVNELLLNDLTNKLEVLTRDMDFNYQLYQSCLGRDLTINSLKEISKTLAIRLANVKYFILSATCRRLYDFLLTTNQFKFKKDIYRFIYDLLNVFKYLKHAWKDDDIDAISKSENSYVLKAEKIKWLINNNKVSNVHPPVYIKK